MAELLSLGGGGGRAPGYHSPLIRFIMREGRRGSIIPFSLPASLKKENVQMPRSTTGWLTSCSSLLCLLYAALWCCAAGFAAVVNCPAVIFVNVAVPAVAVADIMATDVLLPLVLLRKLLLLLLFFFSAVAAVVENVVL
jgi:hypothetical protein